MFNDHSMHRLKEEKHRRFYEALAKKGESAAFALFW
jgi:hypothetical protein